MHLHHAANTWQSNGRSLFGRSAAFRQNIRPELALARAFCIGSFADAFVATFVGAFGTLTITPTATAPATTTTALAVTAFAAFNAGISAWRQAGCLLVSSGRSRNLMPLTVAVQHHAGNHST